MPQYDHAHYYLNSRRPRPSGLRDDILHAMEWDTITVACPYFNYHEQAVYDDGVWTFEGREYTPPQLVDHLYYFLSRRP